MTFVYIHIEKARAHWMIFTWMSIFSIFCFCLSFTSSILCVFVCVCCSLFGWRCWCSCCCFFCSLSSKTHLFISIFCCCAFAKRNDLQIFLLSRCSFHFCSLVMGACACISFFYFYIFCCWVFFLSLFAFCHWQNTKYSLIKARYDALALQLKWNETNEAHLLFMFRMPFAHLFHLLFSLFSVRLYSM